jgi:hypothetical protein
MATVPQTAPVIQAKYAVIYDEACTIARVNDVLHVIYDDGRIEPFEVEMAPFTTVLGDVQTCELQAMWDRVHGGCAAICTSRTMQAA